MVWRSFKEHWSNRKETVLQNQIKIAHVRHMASTLQAFETLNQSLKRKLQSFMVLLSKGHTITTRNTSRNENMSGFNRTPKHETTITRKRTAHRSAPNLLQVEKLDSFEMPYCRRIRQSLLGTFGRRESNLTAIEVVIIDDVDIMRRKVT